jgi:GNAT superfamily N-acetyltransferase
MSAVSEKEFGVFLLIAYERPAKNEWSIDAHLKATLRLVGTAEFAGVYDYEDEDRPLVALKGWNVEVHPDFRKKGLATAMYDFAEEAFGLRVIPGSFQTPLGKAFFKKRLRS